MSMYVFTGPSLPPNVAARFCDAVFLPPVSQGDVIRVMRERPTAIGIIDGYFENVPAVWHKEILHALDQGVAVYGSASMGALRAAELAPFGMRGVGAVYRAFRSGLLEDDDEVAVQHGPAELGYPLLSEAMVNIRRTLSDALAQGIIGERTRRRMEDLAKLMSYRDRTYARVIARARQAGAIACELDAFARWLPEGRADQKREDAMLMLRCMQGEVECEAAPDVRFNFERTGYWEQAVRWAEADAARGLIDARR